MLLNTEETYKNLQPFTSIQQLNENTKAIRQKFGTLLTKSARNVLDVLHRYSCKFPGVCFLTKKKIAEMIGVTRRTVIRACDLLEKLGIIEQFETKRANGDKRQSSNAIVFIKVESENVTAKCHTINTPLNTQFNNTNDTYLAEQKRNSLINKGLEIKLPKTLQKVLAPFFDGEQLYKFSGIVFKAKASIDKSIMLEDYETDYYNSILSVINSYKRGKAYNLEGLLYHAVKSTTRSIWIKERHSLCYGK